MTEIRAKAIQILEEVPDEHIAEVINFMEKFNVKNESKSMKAYKNFQKYRNRGTTDINYKDELTEVLTERYENLD